MNRLLAIVSLAVIFFIAGCAPRIYKAPEFDNITANHKIVAILPAEVLMELRPAEMKRTTPEKLRRYEEETGFIIQDKMYSWFLRKSGRRKYTVEFQDISKTNALLRQSNVGYFDLSGYTREQLASMLGVDAVISTRASMKKPMSEGAAAAMGLLVGIWGNTNEVQTSISIHEGKQGKLVWKHDYQASGSVGSNPERLVDALMRNASKRFPYNSR